MKKISSFLLLAILASFPSLAATNQELKDGLEGGLVFGYVMGIATKVTAANAPVGPVNCADIGRFTVDVQAGCEEVSNSTRNRVTCDEYKEIVKRVSTLGCVVQADDEVIAISLAGVSEGLNRTFENMSSGLTTMAYRGGMFVFQKPQKADTAKK